MNDKLEGDAPYLTVLGTIAAVLAGMNLFYNNLLLNLRYKCKADCYTLGWLVYDVPNLLCLHPFCHWLCRDKWGLNIGTPVKWSVKFIYLVVTIALIKDYKKTHPELSEFDPDREDIQIIFDDLLIVYLLQHLIFIAMRLFFLCLFLYVSCCYDHGEPYEKQNQMSDVIISFDYIKYTRERFGNFEEKPTGLDELKASRELQIIRNLALEETRRNLREIQTASKLDHLANVIANTNHPSQLIAGMREGLVDLTGFDESNHTCMICTNKLKAGQDYIRLGCSMYHVYHCGCFDQLKQFYENEDEKIKCPTCAVEFDREAASV